MCGSLLGSPLHGLKVVPFTIEGGIFLSLAGTRRGAEVRAMRLMLLCPFVMLVPNARVPPTSVVKVQCPNHRQWYGLKPGTVPKVQTFCGLL